MDADLSSSIRAIWAAVYSSSDPETSSFPATVGKLLALGVTRYHVDYVATTVTTYVLDTASPTVLVDTAPIPAHAGSDIVDATWDPDRLVRAIRAAQASGPDYTYVRFVRECVDAGVTDYTAYLTGKRVVYSGGLGDLHVEWFPGSGPGAKKV